MIFLYHIYKYNKQRMNYLMNYNKTNIDKELLALIKCKITPFTLDSIQVKMYTYTLNIKKHVNEDDVYSKNPALLAILPRACSLLVFPSGTIEPLMGPTKFAGKSCLDEDPDDDTSETETKSSIFDFSKVTLWASVNHLEIVSTKKENGKFWITRVIKNNIII